MKQVASLRYSVIFKKIFPTRYFQSFCERFYRLYACPKYVTEATPEPYREWLLAIADSLDEAVDETAYQRPEIQQIFDLIARDLISPSERARMKDEYSMEQLQPEKKKEGFQPGMEQAARNFKALSTLTDEQIAQATGLTVETVKAL